MPYITIIFKDLLMKKIPLFLKVLVPIFIAVAAAGAFFAIKLADTAKKLDEKTAETEAAQAVPSDKYKSDFEETKDNYEFVEYDYVKQFYYYSETEIFHRYEYGNTEFVSFSEFWDEDMLKDLRDELFANEHGDEIYDLDSVVVYNSRYYDYPSVIEPDYERIDVAVSLYEIFPFDFKFPSYFKKNIISLDSGDFDTTIEDTAYELSHKYGLYYMNYYFDLYGDDIVEDDPYFKLRYDSDYDIFYKEDDYSDYDTYFENKESYLLEIAADDYVYLMGSPNTKKTCEFLDTYDELALDVKNKDDELREYFETTSGYHFNQTPISNVALPLPDRVDGLPSFFTVR